MRIAQVSPLYESVPPRLYGGTERVVSFLTEELVAMGHQVTLFASGDSRTSAELVASTPAALRLQGDGGDPLAHHLRMIEQVYARADDFDLIHFHIDYIHFPTSRARGARHLTTLHGRLDAPELVPLYRTFCDMPLVSISDAQRRPLPVRALAGDRAPRPAARPLPLPRRRRARTWRFSAASRATSASTARSRSRAAWGCR